MSTIRQLRETDKFTFYGVFIENYAHDQAPFKLFESDSYDKALACKEALEKYGITNRHQYNKSEAKASFIKAGCEI